MSNTVYFAHFKDSWNLGDRMCSPQSAIAGYGQFPRIHTREIDSLPEGSKIVLGGGGLFWPEMVDKMERWADKHQLAIWGVGLNHDLRIDLTERLRGLFLKCKGPVGIRNRGLAEKLGVDWAPCPSCAYEDFDRIDALGNSTFFFQHVHRAFVTPQSANWMDNGKNSKFGEVIDRIRKSKTVVTNSFHGAYWAQLLGKSVILWSPEDFGNRFISTFPSLPRVSSWEELLEARRWCVQPLRAAMTGLLFRRIHREATFQFSKEIVNWLGL